MRYNLVDPAVALTKSGVTYRRRDLRFFGGQMVESSGHLTSPVIILVGRLINILKFHLTRLSGQPNHIVCSLFTNNK